MKPNDEMKRYAEMVQKRNIHRKAFVERYFPKDSDGVEVGVLFGDFSQLLLDTIKPKSLTLIDPWLKFAPSRTTPADEAFEYVTDRFKNETKKKGKGKVTILRSMSEDAAKKFDDESLDFVYIDGDHSFRGCTIDINAWWSKVKKGGIMAGDDFRVNNNGNPFGTVQAVKDFLANGGVCEEFHIVKDQFVAVK